MDTLFCNVFKMILLTVVTPLSVCDWEAQYGTRNSSCSLHIWSLLGDLWLQLLLTEPVIVYISGSKLQNGPLLGMNHFISWPLQARSMSLLFFPRCSPEWPCCLELCFALVWSEQDKLDWIISTPLVEIIYILVIQKLRTNSKDLLQVK